MRKIFSYKNTIYLFLIILGVLTLFNPPTDPDFGWHYKYGEYSFLNKSILKDNIFSHTNSDYKWANSYWISEIIIYASYNFYGSTIPSIVLGFLFSVFLILILNKRCQNIESLVFYYISTLLVIKPFTITVRPFYYSSILLLVLIYILFYKKYLIKFFPIFFAFWANVHADFVIALLIFGAYSLNQFINKAKQIGNNQKPISINTYIKIFTESFGILFFSVTATLINPFGIELWKTLAGEMAQPVRKYAVAEWKYLNTNLMPIQYIFIISVIMAVNLVSSISYYKRSKNVVGIWYPALSTMFYLLSVKSVYFIRILALFSFPSVIAEVGSISNDIKKAFKSSRLKFPKGTLLFLLILLCIVASHDFIYNFDKSKSVEKWSYSKKYPYRAVEYIKNNPINGKMWNRYEWGGYLIWQLPDHKTFIDGRMASWRNGDDLFFKDYLDITFNKGDVKKTIEKTLNTHDISWVLDTPNSHIVKYLKENSTDTWETLYEDDVSTIMKRLE